MLGHVVYGHLCATEGYNVSGTVRSSSRKTVLREGSRSNIIEGVNALDPDSLNGVLDLRPDVVINCIGIIKQSDQASDPIKSISINSLFPHLVAEKCAKVNARLIHISTDCVFSGQDGNYQETDTADASDLYGRSKLLGETHDAHTITIRTSIIGPELTGKSGLLEWFLSQESSVNGFTKAIFSGLTTYELANVLTNYVIPNRQLSGVYHVSADPIAKFDLLSLIADVYGKKIQIERFDDFVIDRSLNSDRFKSQTGYNPPDWKSLIKHLCVEHKSKIGHE